MHRRRGFSCAGLVLAEQEGQRHQAHRHPRQLHIDILVGLHLRLAIELVIDVGQRHAAAVRTAKVRAKETAERLRLLLEGAVG